MDWSQSPLTLDDYFKIWQAAIARRQELAALYSFNTQPLRDAITDEEYHRALYFRLRAEQEGET